MGYPQFTAKRISFFLIYILPYPTPDSKVHGANMGTTWVLSAPDKPHVDPMNIAIRDVASWRYQQRFSQTIMKLGHAWRLRPI